MEYWNTLTQIGINNGLSRTSKLAIQTVNTLAMLGFVLSVFSIVIAMGSQSNWATYFGLSLGWLGALFLNAKRQYYISAIVASVLAIIQVLLVGHFAQNQSWFLWLLPVAVFPFFIFSVQYKNTALGLALTTIAIYVSLQVKLHQGGDLPFAEVSVALGLVWWGYFAKQATEQTELALLEERANSKRLLHNFLPEKIAEQLRESGNKPPMIAQRYEHVTVLFADIVNFTPMSEKLSPEALVEVLNELFTEFDMLIAKYKLEKIKTIGDAYMVAGGLPEEMPNHEEAAADFALEMLAAVKRVDKKWRHGLDMRIGMHCGPVVAGVIGQQKFAFDMWGDTVNVAARMESHGVPGHVHISEPMADILQKKYLIAQRGWVEVKGKGMMQTFWLKKKEVIKKEDIKELTQTPSFITPSPLMQETLDEEFSDSETVDLVLGTDGFELTNPNLKQTLAKERSAVQETVSKNPFSSKQDTASIDSSPKLSAIQSSKTSKSESTNVFSRKTDRKNSTQHLKNAQKDTTAQSPQSQNSRGASVLKSSSKANPFRKRK